MPNRPSKNMLKVMNLANAVHVGLYRMSKGKFANTIANMPILLLTTTGRKSGKPHTNPVVFLEEGNGYLISASAGGAAWAPGWYYNLKQTPVAKIEIGARPYEMRAEIVEGKERDRLYEKFKAASSNFVKYEKATSQVRVIPVIRLMPVGS